MILGTALEYPRIFLAGHTGLVGSAIRRRLGGHDLILRSRAQCDLSRAEDVAELFARERPNVVVLAAAAVGGILHNRDKPADMIRSNLHIQCNIIEACAKYSASLCFLGSSCIYPRNAEQPISEDALLTGPLEPTNSAYAIAKIAGIEMCKAYAKQHALRYVALMPCNLYGPGCFSGTQATHVIPMLIRRFHDAKIRGDSALSVWGTGRALREFMHVDDLAEAATHMMTRDDVYGHMINIGTGSEISIHALATMIAEIVGYEGDIAFDHTRPDGTPRKVLDVTKAARLGWSAKIGLVDGLKRTYDWYVNNGAWS